MASRWELVRANYFDAIGRPTQAQECRLRSDGYWQRLQIEAGN